MVACTFKVGGRVKWNEDMADTMEILNLKDRYGEGPFILEEVTEYSGHCCPECGSPNLEVGHDDLIDDGVCSWDGSGDTCYHNIVVRVGPDPKDYLGADWFVPA